MAVDRINANDKFKFFLYIYKLNVCNGKKESKLNGKKTIFTDIV